jgi:ribosome-associated translation inhibitor RaiA
MVLNVACRDSALTLGSRQAVAEVSFRLSRYFTDILTVDWDLTMAGVEHVAHCRLHCRDGFFRVTARAMEPRLAIHNAVDKLLRQRRSDKRQYGRERRHRPAATV